MPEPSYGFKPSDPDLPSHPLDDETPLTAGITAAVSGAMGATLLIEACSAALERSRGDKAAEKLRDLRRRAAYVRRDLIALVHQNDRAVAGLEEAVDRLATGEDPGRTTAEARARLFAAEVPLRTAGACHQVLHLAVRSLGRCGVREIERIGGATALAYSGVVGGVLSARCALMPVQDASAPEGKVARDRAARMLREAEALRSQILDRVRRHIP